MVARGVLGQVPRFVALHERVGVLETRHDRLQGFVEFKVGVVLVDDICKTRELNRNVERAFIHSQGRWGIF